MSTPLGFSYSVENLKSKDIAFTLDFTGSSNAFLLVDGAPLPPGDVVVVRNVSVNSTCHIATCLQKNVGESLSTKTRIMVAELSTATSTNASWGVGGGAPTTTAAGGGGIKGPVGAGFRVCNHSYNAKEDGEMSCTKGDEIFVSHVQSLSIFYEWQEI